MFFNLDGARRLHSWLRLQGISTDQLRLASRSHSSLWALDVVTFQRSKEHLKQLDVTDSQWLSAFTTNPRAVLAPPERVDAVVAWLEAKPLGLSMAKVAKLWLLCQVSLATPQMCCSSVWGSWAAASPWMKLACGGLYAAAPPC